MRSSTELIDKVTGNIDQIITKVKEVDAKILALKTFGNPSILSGITTIPEDELGPRRPSRQPGK